MSTKVRGEEGSVLIEALAALAIISTAVVMGLSGFADAVERLKWTNEKLEALNLARNLMTETLGSAVSIPSQKRGASETGFSWSIRSCQEPTSKQGYLAKPYKVVVTVAKHEGPPLIVLETTAIALDRQ